MRQNAPNNGEALKGGKRMNIQLWNIKRLINCNLLNKDELLEVKALINRKLAGEEEWVFVIIVVEKWIIRARLSIQYVVYVVSVMKNEVRMWNKILL